MREEPRRGHTFHELREAQQRVRDRPRFESKMPSIDLRWGRFLLLGALGYGMILVLQSTMIPQAAMPQFTRSLLEVGVALAIMLDMYRTVADA